MLSGKKLTYILVAILVLCVLYCKCIRKTLEPMDNIGNESNTIIAHPKLFGSLGRVSYTEPDFRKNQISNANPVYQSVSDLELIGYDKRFQS